MTAELSLFDAGGRPVFDLAKGMYRPGDAEPAKEAAVRNLAVVHTNRVLICQLLFEHDWLTQFCPYVLMGCDVRYKQTAIGPRFKRLELEGFIVQVPKRRPRDGAETSNLVSTYKLTDDGRVWLRANWPEVPA